MSKADELKAKNENLFERNTILLNENERLKKENAELKAEIENDRDLPTVAYMQGAENQKNKDEKQLAKAKEIIALGLRVCETSSIEYLNLYQKQAEQFLKEIDK